MHRSSGISLCGFLIIRHSRNVFKCLMFITVIIYCNLVEFNLSSILSIAPIGGN